MSQRTYSGRWAGLLTLLALGLSASFSVSLAQESPARSDSGRQTEESEDYFKRWLQEDVVLIISTEEQQVFSNLQTPEEKEQFIEEFWRRRDSDPATAFNEFKEEHYRRLAYANENFKAGKSGWRTDRGRIYIMWGPPDSKELHPAGTLYTRKISEGGGQTKTFPFEVWYYKNLPGVGSDIEVEFVDKDMSGDYKIAISPEEKDALLYVPGAGNTFLENMGMITRADRIREMSLGRSTDSSRPDLGRPRSFDRLREYFELKKGPPIELEHLREKVESRVAYDQLSYRVRSDCFWVQEQSFLIPVTVEIANQELSFRPRNGVETSEVEIYGLVENLSGRRVYEFEQSLVVTAAHAQERSLGRSLYQESLPLDAGRYKLTLVVRDKNSEKIGTRIEPVIVPAQPGGELGTSSLILADRISPQTSEQLPLNEPFQTISGFKVYPRMDRTLTRPRLGIYFEIYNFGVDQSSGIPDLQVKALVREENQVAWEEDLSHTGALKFFGDRVAVAKYLYPKQIKPGRLLLVLQVQDRISDQSTEVSTEITLRPEPTE